MSNSHEFESVLSSIDQAILPSYLNQTQEMVLRETWKGKTYSQIAVEYNYDSEYIKTVGCNLWQVLSDAFNEQITKSNFVPHMRNKVTNLIKSKESKKTVISLTEIKSPQTETESDHYWTTAPQTKNFVGRDRELADLVSWTQSAECRCIIVSGMVGCGKTLLVTKLAETIKDRFDQVIWLSLNQTPSLKKLLYNCLKLADKSFKNDPLESSELNFLLSEFINLLRRRKVVLVLDGLQNIFSHNDSDLSYDEKFENYGQLLRSIITSSHGSLLITSSRIRPKMLEFYSKNQVKFLDLKGLSLSNVKQFLSLEPTKLLLNDSHIQMLGLELQNNPEMLRIAQNYLDNLSLDDFAPTLQDLSILEEIANLIDTELSYLSSMKREIIYWLAICDQPSVFESLSQVMEQRQAKIKFFSSIDYLLKRSLIIESDRGYSLMPVMRSYLRRKLVKAALQHCS